MERLLKPNASIKQQLMRYFRLVFIVTLVFVLAVLRYSLRVIDACNETLTSMTIAESFFEKTDALQSAAEAYLLYGETVPPSHFETLMDGIESDISYLGSLRIGDKFYRVILDIDHALDKVQLGLSNMPAQQLGTKTLEQYYDSSFQEARLAISGIQLEEPGISAHLLSVGAGLQARMADHAKRYSLIIVVLLVVWGVLMLRFGVNYGKHIAEPIEHLTQSVLNARRKKMNALEPIVLEENTSWEVENLTSAFNQMVDCICRQWHVQEEKLELENTLHEQTVENLRMASLLQTSQMQALQRQINPHFLFNTLNMIMDTAYLEEAPETMELLKSAAAFLRYSLDCCEKEVTLRRELQMLGDYVFLQEKRFGERIRFEFDLDESLEDAHLPALVLQPLVENAVSHGVGSYAKDAHVLIWTHQAEDGRVRIDVSDNGVGMNAEQLAELRSRLSRAAQGENDLPGIGLTNVARKARVFFNDAAELLVESREGVGTQVSLLFPKILSDS